jgi:hypothetical protein
MATTTTNYGFDIPQSTDLVKDGATAIATLGQDIDTAMNTALGTKKAGMVLLNTTSFSGVSSVSAPNNTFSATYTNYRILFNSSDTTTSNTFIARLRASGSDNTSSVYNNAVFYVSSNGSTGVAANSTTATSWDIGYMADVASAGAIILEVVNPFDTTITFGTTHQMRLDVASGNTGNGEMRIGSFSHSSSTSFDSISIIRSSGNMSGVMSVYGYNK